MYELDKTKASSQEYSSFIVNLFFFDLLDS